jgi:hypothetical protein
MNVAHDAEAESVEFQTTRVIIFWSEFESTSLQRIANGTKNPSAGIISLATCLSSVA